MMGSCSYVLRLHHLHLIFNFSLNISFKFVFSRTWVQCNEIYILKFTCQIFLNHEIKPCEFNHLNKKSYKILAFLKMYIYFYVDVLMYALELQSDCKTLRRIVFFYFKAGKNCPPDSKIMHPNWFSASDTFPPFSLALWWIWGETGGQMDFAPRDYSNDEKEGQGGCPFINITLSFKSRKIRNTQLQTP